MGLLLNMYYIYMYYIYITYDVLCIIHIMGLLLNIKKSNIKIKNKKIRRALECVHEFAPQHSKIKDKK